MTITLELTAEEEARLQTNAERAGLAPLDYLRGLIRMDNAGYDIRLDQAYRSDWSEEDLADARNAALQRLDTELGSEKGYDA